MKSLDKIPTSKLSRTAELVKTGMKLGGNYLKYYSKKAFRSDTDRTELDADNASDIYDSLKNLKGSALKVAQMLSMEKNLLPRAYVEKFSLSQFSVPPLSAPLVRSVFKKHQGDYPENIFDTFGAQAINAASIGQVHQAYKDGKKLAVKIQYPGVSDSIRSDLAIVKPIATRMFNLKGKDLEKYFKEVESKLLEETDYKLELQQSEAISSACSILPNLRFPKYYEALSSQKIITMDWMDGIHLSEFVKQDNKIAITNQIGQSLWDFYMLQIHGLRSVHADPHPGNFMVDMDNNLIAIDFGCVKRIPMDFYIPYFEVSEEKNLNDPRIFEQKMLELEILNPEDSPKEKQFFSNLFHEMLSLFTRPLQADTFDFGDAAFWKLITALSEKYAKDPAIKKMNAGRGSKHFVYMNRTFFGLYQLLFDLKATVDTKVFRKYLPDITP